MPARNMRLGVGIEITEDGESLRVNARVPGADIVAARDIAELTIGLLGWLNRQPGYAGLGLEVAAKHLEVKRRKEREGGRGFIDSGG